MKIKYSILVIFCMFLISCASAVTWTSASGCWTATDGSDKIIMWNTTGTTTFTVPAGATQVKYLVVAAGGGVEASGAGTPQRGGGGAGEVVTNFNTTNYFNTTPGASITVTVGAGVSGGKGLNSTFSTITAIGGGTGVLQIGVSGGSGGGVTYSTGQGQNGGAAQNTSPYGHGFKGGSGYSAYANPGNNGGGGGGAGSAGVTGLVDTKGGNGGTGIETNITGTSQRLGGGGGGGSYYSTAGAGQDGGGTSANGAANTGGGAGGAAGSGGGVVRTGGSGIVIIRYTVIAPTAAFIIQLTDTSIYTPTSWQWNYTNLTGNNVSTTFSTAQNPVLNITAVGNYLITLIASNGAGSGSTNQTIGISLSSPRVYYWNRTA